MRKSELCRRNVAVRKRERDEAEERSKRRKRSNPWGRDGTASDADSEGNSDAEEEDRKNWGIAGESITSDEEAEELCCAEELLLAEEVLLGLRIKCGFLTQFCETDSGTGPNKSAEKKLEPKRASLVLSDPAPPL